VLLTSRRATWPPTLAQTLPLAQLPHDAALALLLSGCAALLGTPALNLLDARLDLIANYFINRQTSSFVEGLNNKIKVLKPRCYGLRNVVRLFQRLTLDLEGYRRFSPWQATAPR
jgi:hypothetical protein